MDNDYQEVLQELKRVRRLLSILATKGLKQKEQVATLSRAGFTPKEIADLIGTTSNTVSVTLAQLRKGVSRAKETGDK